MNAAPANFLRTNFTAPFVERQDLQTP